MGGWESFPLAKVKRKKKEKKLSFEEVDDDPSRGPARFPEQDGRGNKQTQVRRRSPPTPTPLMQNRIRITVLADGSIL